MKPFYSIGLPLGFVIFPLKKLLLPIRKNQI
jgi:hypothetical protein